LVTVHPFLRAAWQGPGVAPPPVSNGAGRLSPLLLNPSVSVPQLVMSLALEFGFAHIALHFAKSENVAQPPLELSAATMRSRTRERRWSPCGETQMPSSAEWPLLTVVFVMLTPQMLNPPALVRMACVTFG